MRIISIFGLIGALAFLGTESAFSANSGNPQQVNMKIHKMWISANTDCSSMTKIYTDSSPSYKDMTQNPTFGAMNVTNGTYQCVAIQMTDVITGQSAYNSDNGFCTAGGSISLDVFRSGTSSCPDGSSLTGDTTEQTPCVYFGVGGSYTNDAFVPSSPFPLSAAVVVTGDRELTVVTDFRGKVQDTGTECDIQPPVFGIQ